MTAGAVLAGGKSIRFGKNKALQPLGGKRLIDRAVESLQSFCDPVMVIANDLETYIGVGTCLVRDIVPRQGPVGGIYSALLFSSREWVFVKATDMPFLVPELASLLLSLREGFDIVVPVLGGYYEPLCALYSRRCIPPLVRQIEQPEERQIITFYKKNRVCAVDEARWRQVDPEGLSFKNVNTPSDLAAIDGFERS
ncbi:MAG: molybdenum cofactor guanylyltransferase [Desulfobacteraceae bacterium]|nr:molybdenum cofactor guanylyltransferase [Desulfobacteraceae bacterium]